jgi:RNA polymerase sigma factor (sigma-70 family)
MTKIRRMPVAETVAGDTVADNCKAPQNEGLGGADANSSYFRAIRSPKHKTLSREQFVAVARTLAEHKTRARALIIKAVCCFFWPELCNHSEDGVHDSRKCSACSEHRIFAYRFGLPSGLAWLSEWADELTNSINLPSLLKFFGMVSAERTLNVMCETNQGLVIAIARHSRWYRRRIFPLLDLVQSGNLGLIVAAARFDPERGFAFATFAQFWIKQYIERESVNTGNLIRVPAHVIDQYVNILQLASEDELDLDADREKAVRAIAAKVGENVGDTAIWEKRISETLEVMSKVQSPSSLDRVFSDDGEASLMAIVPDRTVRSVEETVEEENDHERLIETAKATLLKGGKSGEMQWHVLSMRLGLNGDDPKTLKQVAAHFRLSRGHIRQIELKAYNKLRKALDGNLF